MNMKVTSFFAGSLRWRRHGLVYKDLSRRESQVNGIAKDHPAMFMKILTGTGSAESCVCCGVWLQRYSFMCCQSWHDSKHCVLLRTSFAFCTAL
jgi:hypothetical protein